MELTYELTPTLERLKRDEERVRPTDEQVILWMIRNGVYDFGANPMEMCKIIEHYRGLFSCDTYS